MSDSPLSIEAVNRIQYDSMFQDGESTDNAVRVEGIVHSFGYHPERLESHREEIRAMLKELPEQFQETGGGGWSFLQLCVDKNGRQWGEHLYMEALICLAMGLGMAKCQMPREIWPVLPGGMPYYVVLP